MRTVRITLFLLCLLAGGMNLRSQSLLGTINGQVTDSTRKPVPAVKVTLVQEETNKSRVASSDAGGDFRFTLLSPGGYRLEVEHAGFRKHVQTLILQDRKSTRLNSSHIQKSRMPSSA